MDTSGEFGFELVGSDGCRTDRFDEFVGEVGDEPIEAGEPLVDFVEGVNT